jgi:hypothetical protein
MRRANHRATQGIRTLDLPITNRSARWRYVFANKAEFKDNQTLTEVRCGT